MRKIGLLDHMGWGNLGDAATQDAVIHHLGARQPQAQICLFSLNPDDSSRRHGLPAFPLDAGFQERRDGEPAEESATNSEAAASSDAIRERPVLGRARRLKRSLQRVPGLGAAFVAQWRLRRELGFLARSYRLLHDFDVLVISGGGQLDDSWGGPLAAPLNLFRWALLARLSRTRLVFLSVGAGPLRARLSRELAAAALRLASFRSFRDEASRRFVEAIGVHGDNAVTPDLAHSLPVRPGPRSVPGNREHSVVGIGPIPYMHPRLWHDHDAVAYGSYVRKLADFAAWLLEHGHSVRFVLGEVNMDRAVVDDVREALEQRGLVGPGQRVAEAPIDDVESLLRALDETDIVLSSRFHGVLLAHLLNKPVIAVSYHQKIDSLMSDMGQPDDCVPIADFEAGDLIRRFEAVRANAPAIKARLAERTAACRAALDHLYDDQFGPPHP